MRTGLALKRFLTSNRRFMEWIGEGAPYLRPGQKMGQDPSEPVDRALQWV